MERKKPKQGKLINGIWYPDGQEPVTIKAKDYKEYMAILANIKEWKAHIAEQRKLEKAVKVLHKRPVWPGISCLGWFR